METLQTAIGIIVGVGVVAVVGIVVWNDVVRPRHGTDPDDQRDLDQARHGGLGMGGNGNGG